MMTVKKVFLIGCLSITMCNVFAQSVFKDANNVANAGYDVVNYFVAYTAERGSKDYSTSYNGATYYFVSQTNLDAFITAPTKYLPQFDGYCAFAVAKMNQKVPVDPKTFRIEDGKLYLFFNDYWEGKPFNTKVPWVNNEADFLKLAETNWKTLKNR